MEWKILWAMGKGREGVRQGRSKGFFGQKRKEKKGFLEDYSTCSFGYSFCDVELNESVGSFFCLFFVLPSKFIRVRRAKK